MSDPASSGRLLDADVHSRVYETHIRPIVFGLAKPSDSPQLLIVGGQPGAGKSRAAAEGVKGLMAEGQSVVHLNTDNLREFHPLYEKLLSQDKATAATKTNVDVGLWTQRAIAEARSGRYTTVLETTLREPENVRNTVEQFKNAGFKTEVRTLFVDREVSNQSIYQRFADATGESAARFTDKAYHEQALANMPRALEIVGPVADRMTIVNRDGGKLYDSASDTRTAHQALSELRSRSAEPAALAAVAKEWTVLRQALDRDTVPAAVRDGAKQEELRVSEMVGRSAPARAALEQVQPNASLISREIAGRTLKEQGYIVRDAESVKGSIRGDALVITSHHVGLRLGTNIAVVANSASWAKLPEIGQVLVIERVAHGKGHDKER